MILIHNMKPQFFSKSLRSEFLARKKLFWNKPEIFFGKKRGIGDWQEWQTASGKVLIRSKNKTNTHTHTHYFTLSLFQAHKHTLPLSVSLSNTHKRKRTRTLFLCFKHTHSLLYTYTYTSSADILHCEQLLRVLIVVFRSSNIVFDTCKSPCTITRFRPNISFTFLKRIENSSAKHVIKISLKYG